MTDEHVKTRTSMSAPRLTTWRIARLVAIAIIVAIGVNSVVWAVTDWHLADMHVYQDAALRLRGGESLYGGDVDTLSAYRYAPWFAYAWVPLTYLPQNLVNIAWSAFLLAGSALAVCAGLQTGGRTRFLLALLMVPILFGISAIGNVQGPMLALLLIGLPRQWAGLAVGVAASLKLVPLVLVLIFMAQRRWWQVVAAIAMAAILWLPALLIGADPVTFDPGLARTLPQPVWLVVAALAVAGAAFLAWRRSPHVALAASTAAVLVLPRLFVYEISLMMVGTVDPVIRNRSNAPEGDPPEL